MPTRAAYTAGTPNWIELHTADLLAAKAFYGSLFGWSFVDEAEEADQLATAMKDDGVVAGIVVAPSLDVAGGGAARWHTYLAVDDLEVAVAAAVTAGATVLLRPKVVRDVARIAFITDPTGASVGLWQARSHIGATLVNEPGTVIWNELMTDDLDAATQFYQDVVGLVPEVADMGHGPYTTLKSCGEPVGGASLLSGGMESHWHVYFAVENAEAAAAAAVALGGEVLAGPFETAIGPMAALRDPFGAAFSVYELTPAG